MVATLGEQVGETISGWLANMALTKRHRRFLFILTHQIRCMLLSQVTIWGGWLHERSARNFLAKLEQAGLLTRYRALIRPLPLVSQPLWATDQPKPNYYRLAYKVQTRFNRPPKQQSIWFATSKAVNLVGGTTAKILAAQASHDCHMTAVFLAKLKQQPEQIADWVGEDIYAHAVGKGKLPDALLFRHDIPYLAIESAGSSYNAERIRAFIAFCNFQRLACEVW